MIFFSTDLSVLTSSKKQSISREKIFHQNSISSLQQSSTTGSFTPRGCTAHRTLTLIKSFDLNGCYYGEMCTCFISWGAFIFLRVHTG